MSRAGLVLVAASGLAREVAEAVAAGGTHQVVGVLDDDPANWGRRVAGVPVSGPIAPEQLTDPAAELLLCAGKGRIRRLLAERLAKAGPEEPGAGPAPRFARVIHPTVSLASSTSVGAGTVLLAATVTTADVTIGEHVVIMPGCLLTHDTVVEDFATLCGGVNLCGSVVVGAGAYLGAGSVIREGLRVGPGAVVGMAAVVLKDVPAGEVWVGNPARPLAPRT